MQGMYTRFPSMVSMSWSAVALNRNVMFAQGTRYSLQIALMVSSSKCVIRTVLLTLIPPFSFFWKEIAAGFWFSLCINEHEISAKSASPRVPSMQRTRMVAGRQHRRKEPSPPHPEALKFVLNQLLVRDGLVR